MLNFTFGAFAIYLATGHTLRSQSIQSGAISEYLLAAARFYRQLDPGNRDPRFESGATCLCEPAARVIGEVRRFEGVPNRQEPYLPAMHKALAAMASKSQPHSMLPALRDWCTLGLQYGNRRGEWCQEARSKGLRTYELNKHGHSRTFILKDFAFLDARRVPLNRSFALKNRDQVEFAAITYRVQKNNDGGQTKTQARNRKKPRLC